MTYNAHGSHRGCKRKSGTKKVRGTPYPRAKYNKRGGSMLSVAALPFGLLALQKLFHSTSSKSNIKDLNSTISASRGSTYRYKSRKRRSRRPI